MRPYMCVFAGEFVFPIPDRHAYRVRFEFALTPTENFGQPDEVEHTERKSVVVTLAGPSLAAEENDWDAMKRRLYWYALKALERGDDSLDVDRSYIAAHSVDRSRIAYPPPGPFQVYMRVKMGYRA